MQQNRNYFIAIALSVLILIAWQFLYLGPKVESERLAQEALQAQQLEQQAAQGTVSTGNGDLPQSGATVSGLPGAASGVLMI